jgi:hypothetical protein
MGADRARSVKPAPGSTGTPDEAVHGLPSGRTTARETRRCDQPARGNGRPWL